MATLFVLVATGPGEPHALAGAPSPGVAVRRYPKADGPEHLASLVRAGRDPMATRWRRGAARAVGLGAILGGATNGLLAGGFGFLGGLLEIAVPLGAGVGAFLGGFTAAMTGTERPRDELLPLLQQARPGGVLVQCTAAAREALQPARAAAEQCGYPHCLVD